ncbi:MAG TPA: type III polyketide synthase [Anaerolineae bacterium]|nr:type III polyketide synthase [Anaerolineae bacterium]
MTYPKILGLGLGVPRYEYSQSEIYERFLEPHLGRNRRARILFQRAGIQRRFTATEGSYHNAPRGTEERNLMFMQESLPLGEITAQRALDAANVKGCEIDQFTVISCTGYDLPFLDLQIAGRLGMRRDLRRTCILGMGCYGAFPGLVRARDLVIANPQQRALMLTVELCSLHFQPTDDTENVIVSALFGDGAAAAVIGFDQDRPAPMLVDSLTWSEYNTLEHMAFHLTDHGMKMVLSAYVPEILGAHVEEFVDELLARNHLRRDDVRFWGLHPGGLKIMEHIERRLELAPDDLQYSRAILRNYGNMSSATILFVLDEIIKKGIPEEGDHAVLMAFGPGLTMEACLLGW